MARCRSLLFTLLSRFKGLVAFTHSSRKRKADTARPAPAVLRDGLHMDMPAFVLGLDAPAFAVGLGRL